MSKKKNGGANAALAAIEVSRLVTEASSARTRAEKAERELAEMKAAQAAAAAAAPPPAPAPPPGPPPIVHRAEYARLRAINPLVAAQYHHDHRAEIIAEAQALRSAANA